MITSERGSEFVIQSIDMRPTVSEKSICYSSVG